MNLQFLALSQYTVFGAATKRIEMFLTRKFEIVILA